MRLFLSDRSLVIDLESAQFWELLPAHFEVVVPDVLWERHFTQQEKNNLLQAGLSVRGLSDVEVGLATHYLRQLQSTGISAADAFALVMAKSLDGILLTHNSHLLTFAEEQGILTQSLKKLVEHLVFERGVLASALYRKLTLICQHKRCKLPCEEILGWLTSEAAKDWLSTEKADY